MSVVVGLGDSVTAGVGDIAGPDGAIGWAAHVAHALGMDFVNLARTGARASHVEAEQLEPALALKPSLALIMVGGNDVLRKDFDPMAAGEHLDAVVHALQSVGATVVVVRLHDPRRTLPVRAVADVLAARATRLDEAFSRVVARRGCLVVDPDAEPRTYERTTWHVDRMHPGPVGHRLLAGLAVDTLAAHQLRSGTVAPCPQVPSRPGRQAWWLVRHGTPWFLKRSVDLIPALIFVVIREWLSATAILNAGDQRREQIRAYADWSVTEDTNH